ncbi:hypothetical protein CLU81_4950 [Flavobacterium sp. 9]|uniref:hypothetical protein n=1 Tax=Flavobacterium sp. 9 TaxID=2035198 RepID=UPI000C194AFE|nr:hypothetical protein [Flavobacterium sp. 9]PIF34311.1 hypothetical protein CLU81_4950 [Flavobacterium sp. 9]
MAQLKVIVNKLNKRTGPITDFNDKSNIKGAVFKGHIFDAEEKLTNILGKWYCDQNGYYYWGGGISIISLSPINNIPPVANTQAGKAVIVLPKAPPKDLPLNETLCLKVARWMETHFGAKCETAVANTPFTKQLLYAIVCKETAIYIYKWIDEYTPEEILGFCVFDASGDANGTRKAFPKNTAAFVEKYGQTLADKLIKEANKTRAIRGLGPKQWVYAGYGLFQYDLQHILTDQIFFEQKRWYFIDDCMDRVIKELMSKWKNNPNDLFHTIKAYNGSGVMAENYANSVLQFLNWINKGT